MKNVFLGFFFILFTVLFTSCDADLSSVKSPVPMMIKMYSSEHAIGKMMPSTRETVKSIEGSTSGFFVLGTGSFETGGDTVVVEKKRVIEFWWNFQKSAYIYSIFSLSDVIINLDPDHGAPSVSFALDEALLKKDFRWCLSSRDVEVCQKNVTKWMNAEGNCLDPQIFFKKYLYKIVITVNPKDWPTSIQLPGNSKKL